MNGARCEERYNGCMNKRVILLIIDGFGIGEAPDAANFGDCGSNTCQHVLLHNQHLHLPVMEKIGLLDRDPKNCLIEMNPNKDTLSGISEMFGSILPKMHTFSNEIPFSLVQQIESAIGTRTLFGKAGSGTVIMKEWGEEHLRTGYPILYTSQDSVLQVLAHEENITPNLLYYYCQVIRELVNPIYHIGRIIARPFLGDRPETFFRTNRRKDFVYRLSNNPILETLSEKKIKMVGNQIVQDIFGENLIAPLSGNGNKQIYDTLIKAFDSTCCQENSLFIADLEDFDMLFGHRRDPVGYGKALEELNLFLHHFLPLLKEDDLLIITADHGNDPTFSKHTDHTREIVPLVVIRNQAVDDSYGHLEGFFHISSIILSFFQLKE